MGSKTDYLEGAAIKLLIGAAFTFTPTANVYIGLFSTAPSDSTAGTELTGGAYARVSVANDTSRWYWVGGHKANKNPITFPIATTNWLAVVAVGIFDAASGGNLMFWDAIAQSVSVVSGSRIIIPTNGLQLTEV